ncbi:MAG: hypothetical protein JO257_05080, partial [Deltaproteobacteria bacterium]|nr:hypothetical protein [Deltaproteobacteria bacterium]
MRDLDLWRRLGSGEVTAAELAVVATWPLSRRGAYVGGIVALLGHADAAVRAAAVGVLAGARGVAGLRAIVQALDDADDRVRAAALDALRVTARDAPVRFAHALFHSRVEVRRAALAGELPIAARHIAARLRADPACAELAALVPWPDHPLGFGFDLFAEGHITAGQLCELIVRSPVADLKYLLESEARRPVEVVDAYLEREPAGPPPGVDVIDLVVGAIAVANEPRAAEALVSAVLPKKGKLLARRAAASLLGYVITAEAPMPILVGACAALEPRVIHRLRARDAAAAANGLMRFQWPVKPTVAQIERLLDSPIAQRDLELAAAVAGLLPAKRLPTLVKRLGLDRTLDMLLASDHGWRAMCTLPREQPPLDLILLQQLEARSPARYVALASIAVGVHTGERLDELIKAIPRKYREEALGNALLVQDETDEQRLTAVAAVIVARLDRAGLVALLGKAHARAALVRAIVRVTGEKQIAGAIAMLPDATVAKVIEILDSETDPPPREREVAIGHALIAHAVPSVRAWALKVTTVNAPSVLVGAPPPRVRKELDPALRHTIATCSAKDLPTVLAPAFEAPVIGLVAALAGRPMSPNALACAALLGCADPISDVARELDRFAGTGDKFDAELDNAACKWLRVGDLPPLANARLYRWEAHTFALTAWIASVGGVLTALREIDALPGLLARTTLWKGISECVMFWRYRDVPRFRREATHDLALYAAERIDKDIGVHAARLTVALVEGGAVVPAVVRDKVLERVADADAPTREYIARLIRLDGMPEVRRLEAPSPALLAEIRTEQDIEAL